MKRWKKIVLALGVLLLTAIGGCVVLVGPWPASKAGYENESYFTDALAAIDANAQESDITAEPGSLQAGWAKASITPPIGTPLAGFSARNGAASTGVHDGLFVKAMALSDGKDTVVIVGSDMLLVPDNVANLVREAVGNETPLTASDILFNASHSHSGPGAWAPGLVAETSSGEYNPAIVTFLADQFSQAIIAAYKNLEPASLAHGSVDAPQFIKNRTRKAPVDSLAHFLVAKQDDGGQCYLVRYSAHPTVLGGGNMEASAEYPGYLQRAIEEKTGADAMYLGGAVGSMGPQAPEAPDPFARAEAMGKGLAEVVLTAAQDLKFESNLDVTSVGVPFEAPPFQVRINTKWRISPYLPPLLGVDRGAWMGAVRVGDVVLVGVPADFSGEISKQWQSWGRAMDVQLWATSFNADYLGYISPDRYYLDTDEKGALDYETGMMSWIGPQQEAFMTSLMRRMVQAIRPKTT